MGFLDRSNRKQVVLLLPFFLFYLLNGCSTKDLSFETKEEQNELTIGRLLTFGAVTYLSTSPFDSYAETNVDWNQFLGTWNEIKRIDNSFQSGLSAVSATYSLPGDGTIRVTNQGLSATGETRLDGVALIPNPSVGKLKVSFFFPFFFGDYLVLRIDRQGYQTALIGGPDPNFLWVFSREKTIAPQIETEYIEYAKTIGYDTNRLLSY
ncbi:lipocalin family protein [Leptospira jelokensis]|uniref:Lipocalin n=1 Tax=Leptospira jelokensis TaxID=2484931 RepID=A0A4Z0ZWG4_9LEPT|nr:lipocalin family protein [Leptospira jelokensis]TGL72463.1 lipocalin [Leptospira jelokensis]